MESILAPLFEPLSSARGIDDRRLKLFYKLLGDRKIDALYHFPSNVLKRRLVDNIADAKKGELITISATALEYVSSQRPGGPSKIICTDNEDVFEAVYFRGSFAYQQKMFPLNARKTLTGKVDISFNTYQMVHPELNVPIIPDKNGVAIDTIYPLTTGITSRCVHRVIYPLLERLPIPPEWIPPALLEKFSWPSWDKALKIAHAPRVIEDLFPTTAARERLIFDELLAHQVSLCFLRAQQEDVRTGNSFIGTGILAQQIRAALPFSLTANQESVLTEIYADMAAPTAMLRLLQGDVGSGKTLVALLAMIRAVESGYQAAILAPTDILARQHGETLISLGQQAGVRVHLLTGREKGKTRKAILEALQAQEIDILIGTHAIIQDGVVFAKLGLAVIDEQHRFGVEQRLALSEKGQNPDILAMTATPIPRTILLANHGDMDVSLLKEKPAGRLPVKTMLLSTQKLNDVVEGLRKPLADKTKIFWVCPLIEESEVMDLAAAEERYTHLKSIFGESVGLVHGRLKAAEKDAIMDQFVNGDVDILISTTVIEVGVNVPAATIMIIEHAERFGLAQLHQLRGRIGRGDQPGTCLLLYGFPLSEIGRKRLEIMRQTNDGFLIAEEDLKLRGGGDILGTKQSGLPSFRIADFVSNPERTQYLLSLANKEAKDICRQDPNLQSDRGQSIRLLLRIFNRETALKYSRS